MTTIAQPPLGQRPNSLDLLRTMGTIRQFEEEILELHAAGEVVGSVHLCVGQEAIPVGAVAAIEGGDLVFATYRGHGWAIARGVPLEAMFGELMGRAGGTNGGRAGSANLSAPSFGFFGENAIVGAQTVIALGPALAARYDGSRRVSVVSLGEGAMNQGATNEALNFAAAFRLPVIFVCENNAYSELTPTVAMVAKMNFAERAEAFGVTAVIVDGNDPLTVFESVREAAERARNGGGPAFIEAMTARLVGHYIGDVQNYRPEEELRAALDGDPIERLRRHLEAEGHDPETILREVRSEVQTARDRAREQDLADVATVHEHVYAERLI